MINITFMVNHRKHSLEVKPGEYLIETLKRLNIHSVRRGCDTASCGVCTVLVDLKPVPSCATLTARLAGKNVTTVEGIHDEAGALADYFGLEGADQCGFCNPGIALSVHALKQQSSPITEADIKQALTGHLCRCSGYVSQVKAIMAYLKDDAHV